MNVEYRQTLGSLFGESHPEQSLLKKFLDNPDKLSLMTSLMRGQIALAKGQIDNGNMPMLGAHVRFQKHNGRISMGQFTRIAEKCRIAVISEDDVPAELKLGNKVYLGVGTQIHVAERIEIGDGSMIARECDIMDTDFHHIIEIARELPNPTTEPIVIGKHVWVGLKTIILKGVRIGDNSVIGAGSVITHDIPSSSLAAGNPARVIRRIERWVI